MDALRQRFVVIEIGPEGGFQLLVSLFGGQTERTARGGHRFRGTVRSRNTSRPTSGELPALSSLESLAASSS